MKRKTYIETPEIVLGNIAETDIPEIQLRYVKGSKLQFIGKITNSYDSAGFLREIIGVENIPIQEHFVVLYLNSAHNIMGYYKLAKGGIAATVADIRLILSAALKCAAVAIIVSHNHPSGNLKPSEADLQLTRKLREAAKTMDIQVLDHLIVTTESYFSFSDEGLMGIEKPLLAENLKEFLGFMEKDLFMGYKHSKRSVEALAHSLKITDKTEIKELTELAIVNIARRLAHSDKSVWEKFHAIVDLYNNQMILSHRTSQSILLQQYSTPAPIAYLMGVFCELPLLEKHLGYAFEPSAGNGLLTISANPNRVYVNEIDYTRNRNLITQGFAEVSNFDATDPFNYQDADRTYQAVLTNPPFGVLGKAVDFDGYPITVLDHLMALRALNTMKDDGKAAIIIGGHTRWDELGRIQKGKNRIFFNYLYHFYQVVDVIQIDGHRLYTRQGTGFPTRLILIDGRKVHPQGAAPLKNDSDKVIKSFDALYDRVMHPAHPAGEADRTITQKTNAMKLAALEKEALALQALLNNENLGQLDDEDEDFDHDKFYRRYLELKDVFDYKDDVLLLETPTMFLCFDEQGIKVAKALRKGYVTKKSADYNYIICGISKILVAEVIEGMNKAEISFTIIPYGKPTNWKKLEEEALRMIQMNSGDFSELDSPYKPASASCVVLHTQVPDSMSYETEAAMLRIKQEVGGDVDNFVRHRLGYATHNQLCKALSAEQIDAVAMSIYNIEAREQGTIIGDQTGIGKGRIAAAMIRYGVEQGLKPIFITEKSNLFSDIYRDLVAIGSANLKPFIINGREPKTDIKDEDGEVVYQALSASEQNTIFLTREVPPRYDFVVGTYSQFNSPERKPEKPNYLLAISKGNLLIMDEAHNSSGSSNTGAFMQGVVEDTKGVVFLSATFAKRPDNMPIYAMKTAIREANLSKDELVEAIQKGGVALQEILSSQLVAEGQMIRRERSFEGVEVNYIALESLEAEHRRIADSITRILRDIIAFQAKYIDKQVGELDKIAVAEGKEVETRKGTSQAGVDNIPYFSKVFNVINQMLFSIKADAVADRTIERLKEGKKPVIAFASTMGSFIEQMENEKGLAVSDGDLINSDFAEVLRKGLDSIMRYTEKDVNGESIYKKFELAELDEEAQKEYSRITEEINTVSTGISISPIDVIIKKLEKAGYVVAEVTGRKFSVQLNDKGNKGLVTGRKRLNTNDAFRMFNNNEADVLMINQSGSTGASAHAIVTPKVPSEQVRQRVMIVLQAELDINTEVQKRGRINRTGQILKPIYDYVISAIPAEKRLMMMLQKKLKSLDANTTSNQKQSTKILDVPDFLNKYGDKVAKDYLLENKEINDLLGDPLHLKSSTGEDAKSEEQTDDAAHKVSGRVAVLSTQMQADFYNDITERYNDYVEYLKQIGEYDLEVEALNLQTETVETSIIKMGKGGESAFGEDSILEKVKANILKKPFSKSEVENLLNETLGNESAKEHQEQLLKDFEVSFEARQEQELKANEEKYEGLIKEVPNEKKLLRILEKQGQGAYQKAIQDREKELNAAKELALAQLQKSYKNKEGYLERILNFFTIGRKLAYPITTFGEGEGSVLAICLGIAIDLKKKNPYAPSAIKLRIALANSNKYLAMPTSFNEGISKIIAASHDIKQPEIDELLNEWEEEIKQKTKDRGTRYIITGNLLQAFGSESGKLVSYTTMEDQTKKGILMPEEWQPKEAGQQRVTVPISKALSLLKSLTQGTALYTNNDMAFFRDSDSCRVILPAARSRGGEVYMDQELWPLIENNKFEIHSDKMKAILPDKHLEAFVNILQHKHNVSVDVSTNMLALIKPTTEHISSRKKIIPPPPENQMDKERIRILELEAEALALELELALAA